VPELKRFGLKKCKICRVMPTIQSSYKYYITGEQEVYVDDDIEEI